MKKTSITGTKLPYESPTIESFDFRVEAGIAESFNKDDSTANDLNDGGWYTGDWLE